MFFVYFQSSIKLLNLAGSYKCIDHPGLKEDLGSNPAYTVLFQTNTTKLEEVLYPSQPGREHQSSHSAIQGEIFNITWPKTNCMPRLNKRNQNNKT